MPLHVDRPVGTLIEGGYPDLEDAGIALIGAELGEKVKPVGAAQLVVLGLFRQVDHRTIGRKGFLGEWLYRDLTD